MFYWTLSIPMSILWALLWFGFLYWGSTIMGIWGGAIAIFIGVIIFFIPFAVPTFIDEEDKLIV